MPENREPVFYRMSFGIRYDRPNEMTSKTIGRMEMSYGQEIRLSEIKELYDKNVGRNWEIADWAVKAGRGDYCWFGCELFIVRVR